MNVSVSEALWLGQKALVLENDSIRTVVVPGVGAKIVSLYDKRTECEWLVDPRNRPFKKLSYGVDFVDQDMSGWDEMFPTIVACDYPATGEKHSTPLPDHGEVWSLSWISEPAGNDAICLSVEGKALHYRLTRTMFFSARNTLQLDYELENLSQETIPYLWSAHPQFECGNEAEIVLPDPVREVCNTIPVEYGWGEPETRYGWPVALNPEGQRVPINRTGPSSLNQARKFFVVPEISVSWAGLIRHPGQEWLQLNWDPGQLPYLGVWVDEGKISHAAVVALEPMTGFYDSLSVAWDKRRVATIGPAETKTWSLFVQVGKGDQLFPGGKRPPGERRRDAR